MPVLDPQKLSHFLAVYDAGTFSSAAIAVGVSQQAISKSIAKLEDSLGVALFERSKFGATPTRFAERLVRRANAIVAESNLAAAEMAAMRGAGRGYVRIGLGWSFLVRIGPLLMNAFKQRYPDVTLSIVSGDSRALYARLLAGDLEMVASAPPNNLPVDAAIRRQPLYHEHDLLTVRRGHPITRHTNLPLEELAQYPWCISMQLQQQWERVCDVFLSENVAPPINIIDLDSILLVKSLILQTDGIALLAHELFALDYEMEHFSIIPDSPFTNQRTAYLAERENTQHQSYTRYLRELFHRTWREVVPDESHVSQ